MNFKHRIYLLRRLADYEGAKLRRAAERGGDLSMLRDELDSLDWAITELMRQAVTDAKGSETVAEPDK